MRGVSVLFFGLTGYFKVTDEWQVVGEGSFRDHEVSKSDAFGIADEV